jgi:hypothetical protein
MDKMTKEYALSRDEKNKRHWNAIVRNFPLSDNCLILTLKGTSIGHSKNLKDMVAAIERLGVFKHVIVGTVDSFDHIKVLDEKRMLQEGWIRQEAIDFRVAMTILYVRYRVRLRLLMSVIKRKLRRKHGSHNPEQ